MAKCSQDIIQRWTDLLLVEKGDIYILHSNPFNLTIILLLSRLFLPLETFLKISDFIKMQFYSL